MPCLFFLLLAWFPRTSTRLGDHFPWKVKMKVQFLKWQGCRSAMCSRETCQRLREGIWERCQDDSTLGPSTLWRYYFNQPGHKNDSHNLPDTSNQWQCYASLWFPVISIIFHWLKFFLKVLQGLRNYEELPGVPPWSYIPDLTDLALHSSFLKPLLRNGLLAFLSLLIKCNSSCQGAANLLWHFIPNTLLELQTQREDDILGGGSCLQALDKQSLYHFYCVLLFCHFYRTHLFFKNQYSISLSMHYKSSL